jgi:predicted GIY-YIG superfamily endonuclease
VSAELSSPAAVVARPVHRVECPCGWVGYRRRPWCRDCPACAIDAAKLRPVWLAGCAPHRGRCCYLGHIWPPPGPVGQGWAGYRHAQHYLGFTTNLPTRWAEHLAGGYNPATHRNNGNGSRLLAAALHAGCTVELVRVWYGAQARQLEQRLKQRRKPDTDSLRAGAARSLRPLCPMCNPTGWWRRYPDLPDPAPPPPQRRFVHDPATWDATAEWNLAFPELAYPDPPAGVVLRAGGAR